MSRTALVAGASGLVGGHLLQLLLSGDAYARVITLARRQLDVRHAKLDQRVLDLGALDAVADPPHVDDAFCCIGTTIRKAGSQEAFRRVDYDYVLAFARAAQRAGARQFLLVTALGADPASRIFYSRVKGEIEQAVRQLPYEGIQIFRPSFLMGERAEPRLAERIGVPLARALAPLLVGPLRRYRPINAADVARAMVQIAKEAPRGPNVFEYDGIIAAARS
ncbi:MAG TPA: NAD-dependent epimerase/dehydratase family protein [Gemmatimonadales bacterium]|nr:NAD-dependent epimerase/dehydratase family protein [Gemmatimonadales bacterium]